MEGQKISGIKLRLKQIERTCFIFMCFVALLMFKTQHDFRRDSSDFKEKYGQILKSIEDKYGQKFLDHKEGIDKKTNKILHEIEKNSEILENHVKRPHVFGKEKNKNEN